jgi:hypothetical protein
MDAHNLDTRRHVDPTRGNPSSEKHEDPRSGPCGCPRSESGSPRLESRFPSFPRKTNSPFTINTDLPSGIPLAKIIVIEAFIQIIQRTDLSIGVGPAGTPSKHPYRAYYFAGNDNRDFLEARVTKPEIVIIASIQSPSVPYLLLWFSFWWKLIAMVFL